MKFSFIFPGQGSQKIGMISKIIDHPITKPIVKKAGEILGYDLEKLYVSGPQDILNETEYSQPAILVASYITSQIFLTKNRDTFPKYVGGHSLGEYSALVFSGAIKFETAVSLVKARGRYMQKAMPKGTSGMAAILGVKDSKIEELIKEIDLKNDQKLVIANYNCPGQIVVSGHLEAIDKLLKKTKGINLPVSAAFHSPLMKKAQENMAKLLNKTEIKDSNIELINNVSAKPIKKAEDIRQSLIDQITSPVLWQQSIEKMILSGIVNFIEFGYSKVLSSMVNRINRDVKTIVFNDPTVSIPK